MDIKKTSDELIVSPKGQVGYEEGLELVHRILAELQPTQSIVMDFRELEYMDSSGIGALIVLHNKKPKDSPKIRLINPPDTIRKLLEICNLQVFFEIESKRKGKI